MILELTKYTETFDCKMSDGTSFTVSSNSGEYFSTWISVPCILGLNPEEGLQNAIQDNYCEGGINYGQIVSYESTGRQNEETITQEYKKHWFWGWAKVK